MFPSRSQAAASVLAGDVLLLPDRRRAQKPGELVADDIEFEVVKGPPFVSRGGIKLAQRAGYAVGRRSTGATRSTSAPRPAGSPTACSRPAPPT